MVWSDAEESFEESFSNSCGDNSSIPLTWDQPTNTISYGRTPYWGCSMPMPSYMTVAYWSLYNTHESNLPLLKSQHYRSVEHFLECHNPNSRSDRSVATVSPSISLDGILNISSPSKSSLSQDRLTISRMEVSQIFSKETQSHTSTCNDISKDTLKCCSLEKEYNENASKIRQSLEKNSKLSPGKLKKNTKHNLGSVRISTQSASWHCGHTPSTLNINRVRQRSLSGKMRRDRHNTHVYIFTDDSHVTRLREAYTESTSETVETVAKSTLNQEKRCGYIKLISDLVSRFIRGRISINCQSGDINSNLCTSHCLAAPIIFNSKSPPPSVNKKMTESEVNIINIENNASETDRKKTFNPIMQYGNSLQKEIKSELGFVTKNTKMMSQNMKILEKFENRIRKFENIQREMENGQAHSLKSRTTEKRDDQHQIDKHQQQLLVNSRFVSPFSKDKGTIQELQPQEKKYQKTSNFTDFKQCLNLINDFRNREEPEAEILQIEYPLHMAENVTIHAEETSNVQGKEKYISYTEAPKISETDEVNTNEINVGHDMKQQEIVTLDSYITEKGIPYHDTQASIPKNTLQETGNHRPENDKSVENEPETLRKERNLYNRIIEDDINNSQEGKNNPETEVILQSKETQSVSKTTEEDMNKLLVTDDGRQGVSDILFKHNLMMEKNTNKDIEIHSFRECSHEEQKEPNLRHEEQKVPNLGQEQQIEPNLGQKGQKESNLGRSKVRKTTFTNCENTSIEVTNREYSQIDSIPEEKSINKNILKENILHKNQTLPGQQVDTERIDSQDNIAITLEITKKLKSSEEVKMVEKDSGTTSCKHEKSARNKTQTPEVKVNDDYKKAKEIENKIKEKKSNSLGNSEGTNQIKSKIGKANPTETKQRKQKGRRYILENNYNCKIDSGEKDSVKVKDDSSRVQIKTNANPIVVKLILQKIYELAMETETKETNECQARIKWMSLLKTLVEANTTSHHNVSSQKGGRCLSEIANGDIASCQESLTKEGGSFVKTEKVDREIEKRQIVGAKRRREQYSKNEMVNNVRNLDMNLNKNLFPTFSSGDTYDPKSSQVDLGKKESERTSVTGTSSIEIHRESRWGKEGSNEIITRLEIINKEEMSGETEMVSDKEMRKSGVEEMTEVNVGVDNDLYEDCDFKKIKIAGSRDNTREFCKHIQEKSRVERIEDSGVRENQSFEREECKRDLHQSLRSVEVNEGLHLEDVVYTTAEKNDVIGEPIRDGDKADIEMTIAETENGKIREGPKQKEETENYYNDSLGREDLRSGGIDNEIKEFHEDRTDLSRTNFQTDQKRNNIDLSLNQEKFVDYCEQVASSHISVRTEKLKQKSENDLENLTKKGPSINRLTIMPLKSLKNYHFKVISKQVGDNINEHADKGSATLVDRQKPKQSLIELSKPKIIQNDGSSVDAADHGYQKRVFEHNKREVSPTVSNVGAGYKPQFRVDDKPTGQLTFVKNEASYRVMRTNTRVSLVEDKEVQPVNFIRDRVIQELEKFTSRNVATDFDVPEVESLYEPPENIMPMYISQQTLSKIDEFLGINISAWLSQCEEEESSSSSCASVVFVHNATFEAPQTEDTTKHMSPTTSVTTITFDARDSIIDDSYIEEKACVENPRELYFYRPYVPLNTEKYRNCICEQCRKTKRETRNIHRKKKMAFSLQPPDNKDNIQKISDDDVWTNSELDRRLEIKKNKRFYTNKFFKKRISISNVLSMCRKSAKWNAYLNGYDSDSEDTVSISGYIMHKPDETPEIQCESGVLKLDKQPLNTDFQACPAKMVTIADYKNNPADYNCSKHLRRRQKSHVKSLTRRAMHSCKYQQFTSAKKSIVKKGKNENKLINQVAACNVFPSTPTKQSKPITNYDTSLYFTHEHQNPLYSNGFKMLPSSLRYPFYGNGLDGNSSGNISRYSRTPPAIDYRGLSNISLNGVGSWSKFTFSPWYNKTMASTWRESAAACRLYAYRLNQQNSSSSLTHCPGCEMPTGNHCHKFSIHCYV